MISEPIEIGKDKCALCEKDAIGIVHDSEFENMSLGFCKEHQEQIVLSMKGKIKMI